MLVVALLLIVLLPFEAASEAGAAGEIRTLGLSLTKGVLYP